MREQTKIPEQLREEVARCAHAIWRERMIEQGWKAGPAYDADAKVHDGLQPFDELPAFRRDLIADWIDADEMAADLFRVVESAMEDNELSAADVEVGASVRLSRPDPTQPIDAEDDYIGRVVECSIRRPDFGRLDTIKVQWPDGEIMEYGPSELEVVQPVPVAR